MNARLIIALAIVILAMPASPVAAYGPLHVSQATGAYTLVNGWMRCLRATAQSLRYGEIWQAQDSLDTLLVQMRQYGMNAFVDRQLIRQLQGALFALQAPYPDTGFVIDQVLGAEATLRARAGLGTVTVVPVPVPVVRPIVRPVIRPIVRPVIRPIVRPVIRPIVGAIIHGHASIARQRQIQQQRQIARQQQVILQQQRQLSRQRRNLGHIGGRHRARQARHRARQARHRARQARHQARQARPQARQARPQARQTRHRRGGSGQGGHGRHGERRSDTEEEVQE